MSRPLRRHLHLVAAALFLTAPSLALAQEPAPQGTPPAHPLVIEQVHDGFVVAPDYRITSFDNETRQLAGVYGGRVLADTLLIGGAGYWMVDGSAGDSLAYGGILIGLSTPSDRRIRFGARALTGGGRATLGLGDVVALQVGGRALRFGGRQPAWRVNTSFFVFEPQATATARVTEHLGITFGAGYRFTGYATPESNLDDRLQGATGSIGLEVVW